MYEYERSADWWLVRGGVKQFFKLMRCSVLWWGE